MTAIYPPNPYFVIQQYQDAYEAFCKDPTQANAQVFLSFIQSHEQQLETVGSEVDYQPYPGATIDQCINDTENAIECYLKGAKNVAAVEEFAGNINYMIGGSCTPEGVKNDVIGFIQFFEKSPSPYSGQFLQWILSDAGFINALKAFAPDQAKFLSDAAAGEKAMQNYLANPTDPNAIAQAKEAMETLLNDLGVN